MTQKSTGYFLSCDIAHIDHKSQKRREVFAKVSKLLEKHGVKVSSNLADIMRDAETRQSSAIGSGVVVKHTRLRNIDKPITVLIKTDKALNFRAFDDAPCNIIFCIFTPENNGPLYLQTMARAARVLKDVEIRTRILGATNSDALKSIFLDEELHKFAA